MFARRYRLKQPRLFAKTLSAGKTLSRNPYFIALGLPRVYDNDQPTRFGIIVSKKVHNRANRRNLLRRRLREIIRQDVLARYQPKLDGYIAVVIIARQGMLDAPYASVRQTVCQWLETLTP